ncbi:hypothetical protein POM88_030304 [Heracleum sosnowskyi]|uniref:Uncharacterized protein n=1 Tax=Heracleum sosnowskyi TaxID=360622 RepID=A0AAD8HWP9_9APIA|nr:hypothetical protein POM88_030304 [Heracleum sosnowskyi]
MLHIDRTGSFKNKYESKKANIASNCGPSKWFFYDRLDQLLGPSVAKVHSGGGAGTSCASFLAFSWSFSRFLSHVLKKLQHSLLFNGLDLLLKWFAGEIVCTMQMPKFAMKGEALKIVCEEVSLSPEISPDLW